MPIRFIFCLVVLVMGASCQEKDQQRATDTDTINQTKEVIRRYGFEENQLSPYWFEGLAEISRYELSQYRYSDNHPGYAVLIFVTEDFLTDKQVKNDLYVDKNYISALKNNQIIKFSTGIYDYSIMNSIFTPVNSSSFNNTLKISSSIQEWCGQTYTQLNLKNDKYVIRRHSYFEAVGDYEKKSEKAILEDEIFNRIRIDPEKLPTGRYMVIPSLNFLRFSHKEIIPEVAVLSNTDYDGGDFFGTDLKTYRIKYPALNRDVEIIYDAKAPYKIAGWKDIYPLTGDSDTTIARKTHERRSAYWNENRYEDLKFREQLGIK